VKEIIFELTDRFRISVLAANEAEFAVDIHLILALLAGTSEHSIVASRYMISTFAALDAYHLIYLEDSRCCWDITTKGGADVAL